MTNQTNKKWRNNHSPEPQDIEETKNDKKGNITNFGKKKLILES